MPYLNRQKDNLIQRYDYAKLKTTATLMFRKYSSLSNLEIRTQGTSDLNLPSLQ